MDAHIYSVYLCMHVCIIGKMNLVIEAENLNTTSRTYQLDNCSLHMHCVIDDASSNDKEEPYSTSNYYLYNGRRQVVVCQANETNKTRKYTHICIYTFTVYGEV